MAQKKNFGLSGEWAFLSARVRRDCDENDAIERITYDAYLPVPVRFFIFWVASITPL